MALPKRIPGAIWKPYSKWPTGALLDAINLKVVYHTTQGSGAGALAWYNTSGGIPHGTIVENGDLYQHYECDQHSRALLNLRGGVQTNLDGAIQFEIAGFAGQEVTQAQRDTLTELTAWLVSHQIPAVWLNGAPVNGRNVARLSNAEWDHGSGFCGHIDVPENNHVDPKFTAATLAAVEAGFTGGTMTGTLDDKATFRAINDLPDGGQSPMVGYWQELLRDAGYYGHTIDSTKGPITRAAHTAFEAAEWPGGNNNDKIGRFSWERLRLRAKEGRVTEGDCSQLEAELSTCELDLGVTKVERDSNAEDLIVCRESLALIRTAATHAENTLTAALDQ